MTDWLLPLAAGFGAGILSAWGVGGGTLLLLVMTLLLDVPQQQAAAVNLLYFLPTAAMGVVSHARNGLLEKDALRSAIPWGAAAAIAGALVAAAVEKVFSANPKSIEDYRAGKEKAFGFLVGQVMRQLKGRADPKAVNEAVRKKLDEAKCGLDK